MEIYLLDRNKDMTDAWHRAFDNHCCNENIHIINDTLVNFLINYNIDGIVSPANSFGIMDGGYDKAIIDIFGEELQQKVRETLKWEVGGYQTPGTCITVPFNENLTLFHTPTMRYPEEIADGRIVFDCMYNTIKAARLSKCKAIVIPAFGGCTGALDFDVIARYMCMGWEYDKFYDIKSNWDMVNHTRYQFYKAEGKI